MASRSTLTLEVIPPLGRGGLFAGGEILRLPGEPSERYVRLALFPSEEDCARAASILEEEL